MQRRHMIAAAGLFVVLTWVVLLTRFSMSAPAETIPRAELHVWDLPGCYRLAAQPGPEDSDGLELPGHLRLAPDSVDQWGRIQDTYRAEPLDRAAAATPFRWFVRADTLWVVWSTGERRGGLALRTSGDGFLGRARVGGADGASDLTTPGAGLEGQLLDAGDRVDRPRSPLARARTPGPPGQLIRVDSGMSSSSPKYSAQIQGEPQAPHVVQRAPFGAGSHRPPRTSGRSDRRDRNGELSVICDRAGDIVSVIGDVEGHGVPVRLDRADDPAPGPLSPRR